MSPLQRLDRPDGERLAFKRVSGVGPTVVWLGGFHSDMEGGKALCLHAWAERTGRAFIRFDYFGHGASSGAVADGAIGRWRDDSLAVVDSLTTGPLILVGSSMGGWLACLVALARQSRIVGLVLIAPAVDFTEAWIEPQLTAEARADLELHGVWRRRSEYDPHGYDITAAFLEEGRRWSLLSGPIAINQPVHILQGADDADVPWGHALAVSQAMQSTRVVFELVKDGDHRLSRGQDLGRLVAAIEMMTGGGFGDAA